MISSIKLHTTGSNSKRLLSDGHFHRTQLGATCLTFVSTSSRMTLATPTKTEETEGLLQRMEKKNTKKNKSRKNKQTEKTRVLFKPLHRSIRPRRRRRPDFFFFFFSASPGGVYGISNNVFTALFYHTDIDTHI